MLNKIRAVRNQLTKMFVDMNDVIDMITVSFMLGVFGVNALLFGPPGTAKTSVVRAFARSLGVSYGELTVYNTIFPSTSLYTVNNVKLVKENKVEIIPSSLVSARIALIDELGRSNETFLNALISYLLDRAITVDQFSSRVRSRNITVYATANSLPQDDNFTAVYDRFQLKSYVPYTSRIKDILLLALQDMEYKVNENVEVIPLTKDENDSYNINEHLQLASVIKSNALKYIDLAEYLSKSFNLTSKKDRGIVIISKRDVSELSESVTYRTYASNRTLVYLPLAWSAMELLHGSIDIDKLARVATWFLTTPAEEYIELYEMDGLFKFVKQLLSRANISIPQTTTESLPTVDNSMIQELYDYVVYAYKNIENVNTFFETRIFNAFISQEEIYKASMAKKNGKQLSVPSLPTTNVNGKTYVNVTNILTDFVDKLTKANRIDVKNNMIAMIPRVATIIALIVYFYLKIRNEYGAKEFLNKLGFDKNLVGKDPHELKNIIKELLEKKVVENVVSGTQP